MITRYIPFVPLTVGSLAFADGGYVGRMKSELPVGQYIGKKATCSVTVTAGTLGEQSYSVSISKVGKSTTIFTLNDRDTLMDKDAQKPSYVGDSGGIAGIRTWLVKN